MVLRFAIAALFLGASAQAQTGMGFDPSKETVIDAERVERDGPGRLLGQGDQNGQMAISQPGVILKADRMEILVVPETNAIRQLTATGKVRYANANGDAIAGEKAVYQADANRLIVTGDVVVLQGGQIATGQELIYDTETGAMTMTSGPGGRVRGLLPQRENG
ncbi:MAG: LptA/OstA family protein [Pseudomonadota bacterium]